MSCKSVCGSSRRERASSLSASRRRRPRVPRTIRKALRGGRGHHPVDRLHHGDGEPLLLLLRGRRLRTLLHQVLLLLSLHRQALHQRARVSQKAVGQARHRIRSARQRALALCGPGGGAAHWRRLSMKRRSRDFSASGCSVCRTPIQRQTGRPAFAIGSRCCRRSFPSLRCGIARGMGGSFSRRSSGRTSIWADAENGAVDLCAQNAQSRLWPAADAGRAS